MTLHKDMLHLKSPGIPILPGEPIMNTRSILLCTFAFFAFTGSTYPAVHVDINATGAPDGITWETAWQSIPDAIFDPSSHVEEIWVADGTYITTVTLQSGHRLYGGFEGFGGLEETERSQRDWNKNPTIIDGTGFPHVVIMDEVTTTTVDGFTITGGRTVEGDEPPHGAGVLCRYSDQSNSIRNNVIRGNRTAKHAHGAGIYCLFASPEIEGNIISQNRTDYSGDGGGIACVFSKSVIRNNIITMNRTDSWGKGAGIYCLESQTQIRDNIVASNRGLGHGAGIYLEYSSATMMRNIISGNRGETLSNRGGGIACDESNDLILQNVICGNKGGDFGGGVSCEGESPSIINNTICDNCVYGEGGGGISIYRSSPYICNNIFARNKKFDVLERYSGDPSPFEYNNFGGSPNGLYLDEDSIAYYNADDINALIPECSFNTGIDPLFADPFPTSGTWTAAPMFHADLFQTTLFDTGALWNPGQLAGMHIFPDWKNSDYCFVIAGNSQTEIMVWGDASGIANTGLLYRIMDYRLQSTAEGYFQNSPCIDGGNPKYDCSKEPGFNGGRINQGAYGNTVQAAPTGDDLFISGHVLTKQGYPVQNARIEFTEGPDSVVTLPSGYFIAAVHGGFSGSMTPVRNGFTFSPSERMYSSLVESKEGQDFTVQSMPPAIYVDRDADGAGNGTSWEDAFTSISRALSACVGGQEIRIAGGLYQEDGMPLRSGITIRGGYSAPGGASSGDLLTEQEKNRTVIIINVPRSVINFALLMGGDLLGYLLKDVMIVNVNFQACGVIEFGDAGRGGALHFRSARNVTLDHLIFMGNTAMEGGGAIFARDTENFVVRNSKFISNSGDKGGAVCLDNVDVKFEDCFFSGNESMDNGGAVEAVNSDIFLFNTKVVNNRSEMHGGGFALKDCFFYASESVITGNIGHESAGGILSESQLGNQKYPRRQSPCIIDMMDLSGRDIRNPDPETKAKISRQRCVWMKQSTISNNSGWSGGGALIEDTSTYLKENIFAGNEASTSGGGLSIQAHIGYGSISVFSSKNTFDANHAGDIGAAFDLRSHFDESWDEKFQYVAENNIFSKGAVSFSRGGGIYYKGPVDMTIRNNIFSGQDHFDIWKNDNALPLPMICYNNLWGNPDGLFMNAGTNPCSTIEELEAALPGAIGNISSDPLFVSDAFSTGTWTADADFQTSTGQTILTDDSGTWKPGSLEGLLVVPDIDLSGDPFVIAGNSGTQIMVWGDAARGVLAGDRYRIHDFHLQSIAGGYPENSPCIDAGDPADDFSNEPSPNGGRINMGPYGNTPEAARSGHPRRNGLLVY